MNKELLGLIEHERPGVVKRWVVAVRDGADFGFPRPPFIGSAAGNSDTFTTTKSAWPTSRSPKKLGRT